MKAGLMIAMMLSAGLLAGVYSNQTQKVQTRLNLSNFYVHVFSYYYSFLRL